jgi:hypothetical protein
VSEQTPYRERLWPGPLGWSFVLAAAVVGGVALTPVGRTAMVLGALVTLLVAVGGAVLTTATVEVRGGELVAGHARIPVRLLGEPVALYRAEVLAALGPGSDARDFVLLRSWLPGGVVVPVHDPADPTPQWLVSSRHAADLAAAIARAQAAHSEQIG